MLRPLKFPSAGLLSVLIGLGAGCGEIEGEGDGDVGFERAGLELASNSYGFAESFHTAGTIDRTNPFFQPNGPPTNERTCETCHLGNQGWTLTPDKVSDLFNQTQGLAPLFMKFDEGNSPIADTSTFAARKKAYKNTLVKHAVTRFPGAPGGADYAAIAVTDPNGFSSVTAPPRLVIFRRPSPTANEAKVAQTNWAFIPSDFGGVDVPTFLVPNAFGATGFHLHDPTPLPGTLGLNPGEFLPIDPPLDITQALAIRDFMLGLFFAQSYDKKAGALDVAGAKGGPAHLAAQPFHVGINDIQGGDPEGTPFSRKVFNLYDAWANADADHSLKGAAKKQAQARAAIYRGQEIFNNREFSVSGVHGLNDVLGQATVTATCSTCHNAPNVGGHSVIRVFDIGTANAGNCITKDYPLVTYQSTVTGETRQVCDAGRAGFSGQFVDIGAFRSPPLRGLAARAPYFHDGQAKTVKDVIQYYNRRFNIYLSGQEKQDLEAFLAAL
jgi:hypothetical protein